MEHHVQRDIPPRCRWQPSTCFNWAEKPLPVRMGHSSWQEDPSGTNGDGVDHSTKLRLWHLIVLTIIYLCPYGILSWSQGAGLLYKLLPAWAQVDVKVVVLFLLVPNKAICTVHNLNGGVKEKVTSWLSWKGCLRHFVTTEHYVIGAEWRKNAL